MKRIRFVSLFFMFLFQIGFVYIVFAQIMGWVYAPKGTEFFNVIPRSYLPHIITPLSLNTKIAGFAVSSLLVIIQLMILSTLIKLFRLFANYEFFSSKNVMYIRHTGYALLLLELVKPGIDFLLGFILTWHNPPGFRVAAMIIRNDNIEVILTSLLIVLVSWIMSEGCKLKDEQQLII